MVTDPSSRRVLAATEGGPQFVSAETQGLQLFALSFRPGTAIQYRQFPSGGVPAVDSLPALVNGSFPELKTYTWPTWNAVTLPGRPKAGFAMVQKVFRELRQP
jgi:hypothetical protein